MGAPPDSERDAIAGFECLHRVAQSYLGPLWIACDVREGQSALRLVRRLALPADTGADKRAELAELGRRARELRHPSVLRVLEVIEQGELAFVYEQIEAEPLRSLQSWANLRGLSFPVGVALRIIVDLLEGVAALHELGRAAPGLSVAGGLSPDSVLVSRSGATSLADPLIASGAATIEAIGCNTAKLAYIAPEQVRATTPPTTHADLFTCAAMLWELLASRRLLSGSRPAIERKLLERGLPPLRASLRNPELVSDALSALVEQALDKDPAARPQSARELATRLGSVGHALAPVDEVAAFVGKLSGPRFDRAAAAVRSRGDVAKAPPAPSEGRTLLGVPAVGHSPASDVETPRGDPFGPSTMRGVAADDEDDEGPTETAALPPISFDPPRAPGEGGPQAATGRATRPRRAEPPESEGAPPTEAAPASEGAPPTEVAAAGSAPAVPRPSPTSSLASQSRWETVPSTKKAPASAPGQIAPFGSRTIMGLGDPAHPALAPSVPFKNLTPEPFAAPRGPEGPWGEPEPSTDSAPTAEELSAAIDRDLVPLSEPDHAAPSAPSAAPERPRLTNPFDVTLPRGSAMPADTEEPLPFQHLLGDAKRSSRPPSNDAPGSQNWFELHAPANASAGSLLARHKLVAGLSLAAVLGVGVWLAIGSKSDSSSAPAATREHPTATDVPAPATPEPELPTLPPVPAADAGPPASAAAAADEAAAPAPGARAADFAAVALDDSQLVVLFALEGKETLPSCAEAGGKRPASDPRRARRELEAAQQKQASGDARAAYELACTAAARQPNNVAAQRLVAELALQNGDYARAKTAVEKALTRSPKDKGLIALRGDVLAMMGDLSASRAAWLRTLPARGSKAARTKKLIAASKKLGDRALAAGSHAAAAAYYRRGVILSRGAYAQSFGLSEALLGLGRTQAALLWAERAAQALPKDSRWQVLFGDALYQSGQGDRAQSAWKAALDVQPKNRTAARRVRDGKPE